MKVWLSEDEKYPDLILSEKEGYGEEVEIPDELVKEYKEAVKRYLDVECKIMVLWEEHKRVNKC